MSGQATGWVLRHGPKDRAMRAVLMTIADAANADGHHAHPGTEGMMRGSLYGRAHVLATVRELVQTGWVVVEQKGGGRGKAVVYGIPGVAAGGVWEPPEKVQSVDLAADGKGPIEAAKGSNPEPETVQSRVASPCSSTVENNEGPTSPPNPASLTLLSEPPPPAGKDPREAWLAEEARAAAAFAFEREVKPMTGFLNVRDRCREALVAGHSPDDLCKAIATGNVVWTRPGLELALSQLQNAKNGTRGGPPSAAALAARWLEANA